MDHFLQGYDCDVKNKLIQGFSIGFKINSVIKKADQKFPNNHRSAGENPEVVVQNINKEILKGRIRGPLSTGRLITLFALPWVWFPTKKKVVLFASFMTCLFQKEAQLIFGHLLNILQSHTRISKQSLNWYRKMVLNAL